MVQEIVFHLGDCKTGTTSVQSVLTKGAWRTAAGEGSDIVYPTRFNHMPLARALNVAEEAPFEAERFTRVRAAFDDSTAAHGVISAEHFEFVDPELVARAIERHFRAYQGRIRLIAYVRPHADRLVSTWAERVKMGKFLQPLEAMHARLLEERTLIYTPRFEKWRALFGEAFTLRPFLRDRLYKGDVVNDFFSWMLRDDDFELTAATGRNESLTLEDITMIRLLHQRMRRARLPMDLRNAQQALGWYLSDFLSALPRESGTRPQLHAALAEQVVATYTADAAALDAAFFEGAPMSTALTAAPGRAVTEPQSIEATAHFGKGELRQIRLWTDVLLRLMAADPEHFQWAIRQPDQREARPTGKGMRRDPGKGQRKGQDKGGGKGRRQAAP